MDKSPSKNDRRGFKIATIGLLIGFASVVIAFLDTGTGDGGSGGVLFKLGFAGAVLGILIGLFGSVIHFATLVDKKIKEN